MLDVKSKSLRKDLNDKKVLYKSFLFWQSSASCSEYVTNGRYIESLKDAAGADDRYKKGEENLGELLSLALKTERYAFAKYCNINDRYIGFAMAEKNESKLEIDRETAKLIRMSYHSQVGFVSDDLHRAALAIILELEFAMVIFSPPLALFLLLATLTYAALEYLYVSRVVVPQLLADYSEKTDNLPSIREFLIDDSSACDTPPSSRPLLNCLFE